EDEQVDEDVEEDEPRGYAVQKTVNAVLAVLSVVLFFLTQPLVWRFRLVDWWTVLFVLLCGTALAMLIWRRRPESAPEEDTDEELAGAVLRAYAEKQAENAAAAALAGQEPG
ncbi:popeye domain-containing protein, partial [Ruthenibacterium lactatiformans]|uniref:popeye domain-containing protein n=1 Tax=Ruthenibacterium lactatiformans TaxID=1550024 RepID=UPI001FC83C23